MCSECCGLTACLRSSCCMILCPQPGERFQLLRFGQLQGEFTAIELPELPQDRAWSLVGLYSRGELQIVQNVLGDSNRDGLFNSSDLVAVFQAGLYETAQSAAWEEGDWNLDGVFDSGDLVDAFQAGTYTASSVAYVPEPPGLWIVWTALAPLLWVPSS